MNDYNARFKKAFDHLRYIKRTENVATLAESLGRSRSNLSTMMNKDCGITEEVMLKLGYVYRDVLNTEWLMSGDGDMLKTDARDKTPDLMIQERTKSSNTGIPFFPDLPVTGGSVMQYNDLKVHDTTCSIDLPFTKTAEFCFPVLGCSMKPTVKEGDMVGVVHVNGFESCNPDRIYLIITRDNERMIKRINRYDKENNCIWLVSDNPQYEPFPIYIDNIVDVYKVVWKISFETM